MMSKLIIIFGLLVGAILCAAVLWALVILPIQLVKPLPYTPLQITEEARSSSAGKVELLLGGGGSVELSPEETAALIERQLEQELGLDISGLGLRFREGGVTAIIEVRISGIPSVSYLSWIFSRSDTEYTSTLIDADLFVQDRRLGFRIRDFRIGNFKIPDVLVRRLSRQASSPLAGFPVSGLEIDPPVLRITGG